MVGHRGRPVRSTVVVLLPSSQKNACRHGRFFGRFIGARPATSCSLSMDFHQACLDCPLWQPLRGPTLIHMMFPTDLPQYPQLASAYFPNYPTKFSSKPKNPSIALCIPFARGSCHLGEDCRLHHIDVSNEGVCKFGSSCIFKHDNRTISKLWISPH